MLESTGSHGRGVELRVPEMRCMVEFNCTNEFSATCNWQVVGVQVEQNRCKDRALRKAVTLGHRRQLFKMTAGARFESPSERGEWPKEGVGPGEGAG